MGWRCDGWEVRFMVTQTSLLRRQREVAKRQPVGAGRRSPARFACSRAVALRSEWVLHPHSFTRATGACPWGGAGTVERRVLW